MTDSNQTPVRSPCVSICKLATDGLCLGCFRHSSEISYWTTYSDEEKRAVIETCKQREKERFG